MNQITHTQLVKLRDSELVHSFENGTNLKIPSETTPPLVHELIIIII